jgi:CRP-like cAMP-binding protein
VGRWQEAPTKEVLIEEGASPGRVLVLASGRAVVKVHGREVATLRLGQFAGEMSFLTGERTTAAVEVVEPARFVSWATDDLERFLGKHRELRAALQLILGRGLAAKLVGDGGSTSDTAPTS